VRERFRIKIAESGQSFHPASLKNRRGKEKTNQFLTTDGHGLDGASVPASRLET